MCTVFLDFVIVDPFLLFLPALTCTPLPRIAPFPAALHVLTSPQAWSKNDAWLNKPRLPCSLRLCAGLTPGRNLQNWLSTFLPTTLPPMTPRAHVVQWTEPQVKIPKVTLPYSTEQPRTCDILVIWPHIGTLSLPSTPHTFNWGQYSL